VSTELASSTLDVFAFGGGVQSTAALVLAATGRLDVRTFLFCNVGEDSEHPDTLRYVNQVAKPYAAANGLDLVELRKTRFGQPETLLGRITRPGSRSIGIPVRLSGRSDGAPARRQCTTDFKIGVIARWLREHGATAERPAAVSLGISMDEMERARSADDSGFAFYRLAYPLLELRLYRDGCEAVIQRAGLPVPPKSACWFCPLRPLAGWRELRRRRPDLFARAAELEAGLNERRVALGLLRDPVYLTRRLRPLPLAVADDGQMDLGLVDGCESGFCWT
jgi:hypothetical protein